MKKTWQRLFVCAFILPLFSAAQQYNGGNPGIDLAKRGFVDNFFQRKADSLNLENVDGTPYITDGFRRGRILLKSGLAFDSVLVRFNAFNNEMYFLRQGDLFVIDTAREVSYLDIEGDSSTLMVFRTGYPPIDIQTERTYYQLVAGGNKVHLIKFIRKQLQEFKMVGTGLAPKKELVTTYGYYLYSASDGMHTARSSRKGVEKALPSYQQQINTLVTQHRLKLTKDDDLVTLVQLLDRQ